MTRNIYSMNSKNKLYLFERLENAGTAETKDVWEHLDKGEYSIEHIMPQHLTTAWISQLGEDYEEIHDIWLHRLSNLTLTAYNSKYSNSTFLDKRDMPHGFKDSGLRINQWIAQKEWWGINELEERGQYLQNRSVQIWKFPVSDYQPPEKQMDMASLDEDVVLTGRVLSKYSFQGAEQPVASWVDMYQQVISSLHAQNKAVLTKLAVSQDTTIDLTVHFSISADAFSAYRQIDTNIFVWTGTDTQYKINVLRKLFALFGVEESELVFYLRDEENAEAATGSRHEIRKRYWEYALPGIKAAFGNNGPFSNVNPAINNYISGFIGIPGVCINCVSNFDGARVEFYLGMPAKERNKAAFDYLFVRKESIEADMGTALEWSRLDEYKASKIYCSLADVDISRETDWPRMAQFHAEQATAILAALKKHLEQYFGVAI